MDDHKKVAEKLSIEEAEVLAKQKKPLIYPKQTRKKQIRWMKLLQMKLSHTTENMLSDHTSKAILSLHAVQAGAESNPIIITWTS